MNQRQKIVQQQFLNNEEEIIKRLEKSYSQALKDIDRKIERLMKRYDPETGDLSQSAIYQINHQKMLRKQVEGILNQLHTQQYVNVSDYLDECYTDGFIGTIFDLHGQDVPFMMPIDQQSMVRAVQLDSKISQGLYTKLGEDVDLLKKKITSEVSRSIATGMTYAQTAQQLARQSRIGFNRAVRIARTEGHRIQNTAIMDAMYSAKDKGADVVKQWDATLDSATRESHVKVDMEIRELDEPFSNGLMFPGDPSGGAAEVVNCRCRLNQRARWALEGSFTKFDGFSDEVKTFEDLDTYKQFKEAYYSKENMAYMDYMKELEDRYQTKDFNKIFNQMTDSEYKHFLKLQEARPQFPNMYRQVGGKYTVGDVEWVDRRKEEAESFYTKIRNTDDIDAVAKSSGMSPEDIQTIKNHIFFDNHIKYDGEIGLFDADYDMAVAWKRLAEGTPKERDLLLLQHELLENQVEKVYNITASEAHELADAEFPWYSKLIEELGEGGEPDGLL